MFGDFMVELVGEVFSGVGRVYELVRVPAVNGVGVVEFWTCQLIAWSILCERTYVER